MTPLHGVRNLSDAGTAGFCTLGDADHHGRVTLNDIIVVLMVLTVLPVP